jgi:hypothetical protein
MDTQEKKIEEKTKSYLLHIKPSKVLFEDTLKKAVTEGSAYRYSREKAPVLSFYQLINNYINMKKKLLIGVPVGLVALVVIFFATQSLDKAMPIAKNPIVVPQINGNILDKKIVKEDDSIDSIIASFNEEAEDDAKVALSESEETTSLMVELQDYNNIKTYTYEDTI